MKQVLSSCSASISELKRNPTALLNEAEGAPIAILNHNVPTAYLIPAETYEWLMDKLDEDWSIPRRRNAGDDHYFQRHFQKG